MICVLWQDEKYEHLDASDMEKVKKQVDEKRTWFEKHINLCDQQAPYENPCVTAAQIKSQTDVSWLFSCWFCCVL